MLRTTSVFGSLLLLVACGSQPAQPATRESAPDAVSTPAHRRTVTLTEPMLAAGGSDTIRFGRLHAGETAVLRFGLKNDTPRTVVITSYTRTCGCTTLKFDQRPIAPGATARLELTFDSRGEQGWQLKLLDIALAGAARPLRLFVEADVE